MFNVHVDDQFPRSYDNFVRATTHAIYLTKRKPPRRGIVLLLVGAQIHRRTGGTHAYNITTRRKNDATTLLSWPLRNARRSISVAHELPSPSSETRGPITEDDGASSCTAPTRARLTLRRRGVGYVTRPSSCATFARDQLLLPTRAHADYRVGRGKRLPHDFFSLGTTRNLTDLRFPGGANVFRFPRSSPRHSVPSLSPSGRPIRTARRFRDGARIGRKPCTFFVFAVTQQTRIVIIIIIRHRVGRSARVNNAGRTTTRCAIRE